VNTERERERERESPFAAELPMSGVVYRLKRSQTEAKHLTKTLLLAVVVIPSH